MQTFRIFISLVFIFLLTASTVAAAGLSESAGRVMHFNGGTTSLAEATSIPVVVSTTFESPTGQSRYRTGETILIRLHVRPNA